MVNTNTILFHYTSQEGLIGITESASIWGTNVLYLNDASEFNYAKNLLSKEIKIFCETNPEFNIGKSWGYFFFESLMNNINKLLSSGNYSCYVSSFSEESDLLSQWRGYCKDGSGYSLGFSRISLQNIVNRAGFVLKPCIYDEDEQVNGLRELVRKASNRFVLEVGTKGENWDTKSKYIAADILLDFIQLYPFIKHPKFEEEREWRIVANLQTSKVNNMIKFRSSRTMIVPYIEIQLPIAKDSLIIDEVVVGPTRESDISMASVELLLKANSVIYSNIKYSTIPYRPL